LQPTPRGPAGNAQRQWQAQLDVTERRTGRNPAKNSAQIDGPRKSAAQEILEKNDRSCYSV
jgi:hypothetical protein